MSYPIPNTSVFPSLPSLSPIPSTSPAGTQEENATLLAALSQTNQAGSQDGPAKKVCRECGIEKDLSEFYGVTGNKSRSVNCLPCRTTKRANRTRHLTEKMAREGKLQTHTLCDRCNVARENASFLDAKGRVLKCCKKCRQGFTSSENSKKRKAEEEAKELHQDGKKRCNRCHRVWDIKDFWKGSRYLAGCPNCRVRFGGYRKRTAEQKRELKRAAAEMDDDEEDGTEAEGTERAAKVPRVQETSKWCSQCHRHRPLSFFISTRKENPRNCMICRGYGHKWYHNNKNDRKAKAAANHASALAPGEEEEEEEQDNKDQTAHHEQVMGQPAAAIPDQLGATANNISDARPLSQDAEQYNSDRRGSNTTIDSFPDSVFSNTSSLLSSTTNHTFTEPVNTINSMPSVWPADYNYDFNGTNNSWCSGTPNHDGNWPGMMNDNYGSFSSSGQGQSYPFAPPGLTNSNGIHPPGFIDPNGIYAPGLAPALNNFSGISGTQGNAGLDPLFSSGQGQPSAFAPTGPTSSNGIHPPGVPDSNGIDPAGPAPSLETPTSISGTHGDPGLHNPGLTDSNGIDPAGPAPSSETPTGISGTDGDAGLTSNANVQGTSNEDYNAFNEFLSDMGWLDDGCIDEPLDGSNAQAGTTNLTNVQSQNTFMGNIDPSVLESAAALNPVKETPLVPAGASRKRKRDDGQEPVLDPSTAVPNSSDGESVDPTGAGKKRKKTADQGPVPDSSADLHKGSDGESVGPTGAGKKRKRADDQEPVLDSSGALPKGSDGESDAPTGPKRKKQRVNDQPAPVESPSIPPAAQDTMATIDPALINSSAAFPTPIEGDSVAPTGAKGQKQRVNDQHAAVENHNIPPAAQDTTASTESAVVDSSAALPSLIEDEDTAPVDMLQAFRHVYSSQQPTALDAGEDDLPNIQIPYYEEQDNEFSLDPNLTLEELLQGALDGSGNWDFC
ncbi:hypothetical protein BJY04DRAFT_215021 [Aspergillus karnatakaensis]|uniref:uncharacterized protein n=1 Tax=Aspergillus karnatakaensis TaxID=1810916 RepID=UPI003CCCFDC3